METAIVYKSFQTSHVESAWTLIEALKHEAVDITFTALETQSALAEWVNNPAQLTYVAIEEATNRVLCLVRGRRDLDPTKAHAAFLTAATCQDARGKGIAAELTQYALNEMKKEGVTIARIYVYSDNHASLQAVSKLGFEHAGTVLRHHKCPTTGEYIHDLIFHKLLD